MSERVEQRDPFEEYKEMPLNEALAQISNAVYAAAIMLESFEDAGRIDGNGHHAALEVALYAQVQLLERWSDDSEIAVLGPDHPAVKQLQANRTMPTNIEV